MTVTRVSFVCMGNICRSPLAEGVFKRLIEQAGLEDQFHIESAGIGPWHVGESPDHRARQTAKAHGLELTGTAQQFTARDFARFDYVIALDRDVAEHLRSIAPSPTDRAKVRLLRESDPARVQGQAQMAEDLDVPDPYYGGPDGFETAYQMIERSCRRLLEHMRAES